MMDAKNIQKGAQAKIASTGQIVEVKRVSNHGFSVVRFQTGGDYMILNDRLETVERDEVQH
ncbi:hypothetical protein MNBD_GAMMA05-1800 [hydrothermal vent metagenome]|uniref:Uncharacterized protein n=1 Tax=hydrothermal vent metagenome TaxID=652676 RepID=A0A3B0WZZ3_9ZZZZ